MKTLQMIFAYGTLRQSHRNHQLLENARYYGAGTTLNNYSMYITGGYPYVVDTEARYPIIGELYAVDDETLETLDKMEGHPHYFTRREVPVLVDEKEYAAWMYVRGPHAVLMSSGDFNEAANSR